MVFNIGTLMEIFMKIVFTATQELIRYTNFLSTLTEKDKTSTALLAENKIAKALNNCEQILDTQNKLQHELETKIKADLTLMLNEHYPSVKTRVNVNINEHYNVGIADSIYIWVEADPFTNDNWVALGALLDYYQEEICQVIAAIPENEIHVVTYSDVVKFQAVDENSWKNIFAYLDCCD